MCEEHSNKSPLCPIFQCYLLEQIGNGHKPFFVWIWMHFYTHKSRKMETLEFLLERQTLELVNRINKVDAVQLKDDCTQVKMN